MAVAEQYANEVPNDVVTTLTAGINNSTTTIPVAGFTGFPASAQYRIRIDSEILLVTGGAGTNSWTATRGAEGTTAASHSSGATVTHLLTRDGLIAVGGQINLDGTLSGRPSAGVVGRLHFPSDGLWVARDNGSSWDAYGPSFAITDPDDSGFAWVNQLSATTSEANGGIFLLVPATATEGIHARVKSLPSAPYTITMGFLPMQVFADFSTVGLLLRNSGNGKIVSMGSVSNTFYQSGGGTQTRRGIQVEKWSAPTTGDGVYTTTPAGIFAVDWQCGPMMWFQIIDDNAGTPKLHFKISNDGVNFYEVFQSNRADYITADQYGFFVRNFTTSYDIGMNVLSLKAS